MNSKKKKGYWKSHFLGLFFCFILATYTLIKYTPENNAKNFCLIFFILSLIISVFIIVNFFSIKNFKISNKKLIQLSFFMKEQKVYSFNEIESWTEKKIKGKYDKWDEIIVYFKNGERIKISSEYFDNYSEIKNEVTKGIKHDILLEKMMKNETEKRLAIIFSIISFLLFYGAYNALKIKDIMPKDIVVFGDLTSENIEYVHSKRSYINIRLKKYPDLIFYISNKTLKATFVDDLISEINKGDSIFLGIDKRDYREKLIKVDSLSISDKYFFNENISVESVRAKNGNYLNLSENNLNRSKNKYWNCFIFLFGGLLLLIMSIIGFAGESDKDFH